MAETWAPALTSAALTFDRKSGDTTSFVTIAALPPDRWGAYNSAESMIPAPM